MIDYSIRRADERDARVIARHRVSMFSDMGQVPTESPAVELLSASSVALESLLRSGEMRWVAPLEAAHAR